MPLVKPTTTAGKVFHHAPMPVTLAHEENPRHHSAHEQAVDPCLAMIPATTTTNALLGRHRVFEPPQSGDEEAVTWRSIARSATLRRQSQTPSASARPQDLVTPGR